ncbi:MAG: response regulator transcription factor [Tissierellia bacterium]|nr:response regulator transcription factor [Tissierellia bacterium]
MIRMLIVENDNFLRELLVRYFDATGKYKVVASFLDASRAISHCKKYNVDIALLDICTEDGNYGGIRAGKEIKRQLPQVKVILMTSIPELSYLSEAKNAMIDSFVYKTDTIESLYQAVEDTISGKSIWPVEEHITSNTPTFQLSQREKEVARLICCECLTRNEIAEKLGISPNTVKTLTDRVLEKTGVQSIRELLRYMLSNDYFLP